MIPFNYHSLYQTPKEYQPPECNSSLAGNLDYPNLNSLDYSCRPLNRNLRIDTAWESISLNPENHAVIGANKTFGREWTGSVWGFEPIDDIGELNPEQACFKLQCPALISSLQYVASNLILVALGSGCVQLWSTYAEVRDPDNPYCMFLLGKKTEHTRSITCLAALKRSSDKAITGCKSGTLKVWDIARDDIVSAHTFSLAHTDRITGVAISEKQLEIFATCSLDCSALLWDLRADRFAVALFEDHKVGLRHLNWQNTDEHLIYLGDESGYVHTVDIRTPNNYLNTTKYFDKPIHKIMPMEDKLAVIGDTNVIKVATGNNDIIYENYESKEQVRDAVWQDSNTLLTVGYEGKMRVHKIP